MNIPWSYYLEYWFKNSMLALATGVLISLLIPQLYAAVPLFGLYFFILYQVVMYRHFLGKRRGEFEYFARETLMRKRVILLVEHHLGKDQAIRLRLDRFNSTAAYGWQVHQKLMPLTGGQNQELSYLTHILGAELARKQRDIPKEQSSLSAALEIRSNDLVGHFRLGIASEKAGDAKASIEHYRLAAKDPSIVSAELGEFIENQIVRVMEAGPSEDPPVPALRFMSW